jgi:predicted lipoprotein
MKKIIIFGIVFSFIIACSNDDNSSNNSNGDTFNRAEMLLNLADNIIMPAFQDFESKLETLVTTQADFAVAPSQLTLDNLRVSWFNAYKTWQYLEMFNIGKAESIQYNFQMNIYPTNIIDIENNISSGVYDLTSSNNNDAVGFPALDYLLYGLAENDNEIIEKYTVNTDAEKYKAYLSDIIDQMQLLTQEVTADWNNGYRDTFVDSTENTSTSAANKIVNDYIFYYEKGLRANKIGIPAGIFSSSPLPEKVEGFYNNEISKELSLIALNAVQDLFNGKSYQNTATGSSFSSYLTQLDRADLAVMVNNKLDLARTKIEMLDDSFYNQVLNDNIKMTQAYDALQRVVVLLKVDMLQVFDINIDYVDADGD